MRNAAFCLLPTSLLFSLATSLQLPQLQPFFSALPQTLQEYLPQTIQNDTVHDILKRQDSSGCPNGFNSCENLGAPNLCCMSSAKCAADFAGHVACCPTGAVCTGTIGGVIYSGTVDGAGGVVGGATVTGSSSGVAVASPTTTSFQFASTTEGNGMVVASASGGGFIIAGSSTVASPAGAARGVQVVSAGSDRVVCQSHC